MVNDFNLSECRKVPQLLLWKRFGVHAPACVFRHDWSRANGLLLQRDHNRKSCT